LVPLRNPEPDDAELVTRALLGERWARAALYHRHARDIANLALSLLRDREEARDVLQDTFVTAFETLSQLRERTKVRAWLCKVAVRHVQRRFRRRRLRRLLGLDFGAPVTIPLDELAMRDAEQEAVLELRRLEAVLRTLPDRACIVWTLRAVEGETLPAIAEIVGCSLATVKRDLSAAQHAIGEATEGEP
jgi:RNA polymerase sigma-70 factor (ECF subfamily)